MSLKSSKALTALAMALSGAVVLADAPAASAHPAPYPHRHYYRRAPPPQPVYRARRPRRPVEPPPMHERFMYLGLGLHGTTVSGADDGLGNSVLGNGAGFDLTLGFRVSRHAALDLGWMISSHDASPSSGFEHGWLNAFTFDLKLFLLPQSQRLEPYVQLGFGGYGVTGGNTFTGALGGVGVQAGGGLDVRLTDAVSIGGKALFRGAYLDDSDPDFGFGPTEQASLGMFTLGADLKLHF